MFHIASGKTSPQILIQENAELREAIKRLNERLNEPFVTVNTVTGDLGIKTCASRAQTSSLDLSRCSQVYPKLVQAERHENTLSMAEAQPKLSKFI